jgi:putative toxin-antitoxin system antitoxin component (TIGR02293 family)
MSDAALNPNKHGQANPKTLAASFWRFTATQDSYSEAERLKRIHEGFSPTLTQALRVTFRLQEIQVEVLLNASTSTLERRRKEHKRLDSVASERLDRIATVSRLAEEVFEDKQAATDWLSRCNDALGGQAPIMLCETDIGAKQVRRTLHAIEWGGAA